MPMRFLKVSFSTFNSGIIDMYLTLKKCSFLCLLGHFTDPAFPDIYSLEVEEGTSLECGIAFSPKEVCSAFYYSFYWGVVELDNPNSEALKGHLSSFCGGSFSYL